MPRKPKDPTAVFIGAWRARKSGMTARRRGPPGTPATVVYHEAMLHLAELVAKHRDAGLPVKSELPARCSGDVRNAIDAAIQDAKSEGLEVTRERVRRAWLMFRKTLPGRKA